VLAMCKLRWLFCIRWFVDSMLTFVLARPLTLSEHLAGKIAVEVA
jgi:hypothetical protein